MPFCSCFSFSFEVRNCAEKYYKLDNTYVHIQKVGTITCYKKIYIFSKIKVGDYYYYYSCKPVIFRSVYQQELEQELLKSLDRSRT